MNHREDVKEELSVRRSEETDRARGVGDGDDGARVETGASARRARAMEEREENVEAVGHGVDDSTTRFDATTIETLRQTLAATLPPQRSATRVVSGSNSHTSTSTARSVRGEESAKRTISSSHRSSSRLRESSWMANDTVSGATELAPSAYAEKDNDAKEMERERAARRARRELRRQARAESATIMAESTKTMNTEEKNVSLQTRLSQSQRDVEKRRPSTKYIRSPKDSFESKLEKLMAVAERAGSTAERVHDEITNLGIRVELENGKPVPMQPWQEHGNSWAGDRRSSRSARDDEKSSSAGTILNPKQRHSRDARAVYKAPGETPSSPQRPSVDRPKIVTSVLRSDLLKSMGEMSADEKLERLGLKSVREDEFMGGGGTPVVNRSTSASRRAWQERSPRTASQYSEEDDFGFVPPAPAPSVRSHTREISSSTPTSSPTPTNYVEKLKEKAKLARAESARTWRAGGVGFKH